MSLYLDTSVLVPIYIAEKNTKDIREIIINYSENIVISKLAIAEFHSALAIKQRTKSLSMLQAQKAKQIFKTHVDKKQYELISLPPSVFDKATEFLDQSEFALRTLDALHLSVCAVNNIILLTADKVLASNAQQFNVPVKLV